MSFFFILLLVGNGQMLVGCRERVQVRAVEMGIAREPAARELRSKWVI